MIDKVTSSALRGKVYNLTRLYAEYATVAADPNSSVNDLNTAYSESANAKAELIELN